LTTPGKEAEVTSNRVLEIATAHDQLRRRFGQLFGSRPKARKSA
jgi:hypothetical protein